MAFLRDIELLAVLLEQETSLRPTIVMTNSGPYSDQIFGLFLLLGHQFSPRLADAGDAYLWRVDPKADYNALNGVARNCIDTGLIARHWDDLLGVAGSLKMGTVGAVELMRSPQGGSRQSTLARAIGEAGRIPKTLHLLDLYDDESYRRRIVTQLDCGESRHSLARAVFHERKRELRQATNPLPVRSPARLAAPWWRQGLWRQDTVSAVQRRPSLLITMG